ncbi:MAG TPA: heme biosynthesis HemY N-terminal domain-containing protein [Patescibacteria group bacterium]|nr:heme biosynthesis HemY N-terminal domain-containing protein [Patescibacteria group bacterium]
MTLYRLLLVLLLAAVIGALAVYGLRGDTGYVLIQRGDVAIETTLVNAVFLLLAALAALYALVWLLRWPLRMWKAGARRSARRRFLDGMIALVAGRPNRAGQQLLKAAKLPSLKLPALIAAHAAAHARGDRAEETRLLDPLTEAPETHDLATELRARNELLDARAGAAIEMLVPLAQASRLSPMGARWLIEALAVRKRAREALAYLPRIRQSQQLPPDDLARFVSRILVAAIEQTTDAINLHALWADLNRDEKRIAEVAIAYAKRSVQLNLVGQAAQEIEATLKHGWAPTLVLAYGALPPDAKVAPRLKTAEGWLEAHANDAALLLTLGRLSRQEHAWIKAEDYLRRAIAFNAGADAWEELGRCYAEQGDADRTAKALANALAVQHGEVPASLIAKHSVEDLLAPLPVAEERDDMGIPRLPR